VPRCSTGQLWQTGGLVGKPAGMFVSTATQGGGQETTILTAVTQFAAHGMPFVPIGASFGGPQFMNDEVRGGSSFGAGTFANGDGSRMPTERELAMATHQGAFMAAFIKRLN
jgi:NAD(P)H dehydrogenase (quinone)